jgi:hypothetical protein
VNTLAHEMMAVLALEAVVRILHEDLAIALTTGSEYRGLAAAQWAADAAHRARLVFPALKHEEES